MTDVIRTLSKGSCAHPGLTPDLKSVRSPSVRVMASREVAKLREPAVAHLDGDKAVSFLFCLSSPCETHGPRRDWRMTSEEMGWPPSGPEWLLTAGLYWLISTEGKQPAQA